MKISKILAIVVMVGLLFAMSTSAFAVPMEGCPANNDGPHLNTEAFWAEDGGVVVICWDCHQQIGAGNGK
jgi:hypothetical protein